MAGFTEKMYIDVDKVSLRRSLNTLEQQNMATSNKITDNARKKSDLMVSGLKKMALGVTAVLAVAGGAIASQIAQIEGSVNKLKQIESMLDDIDTTATQFSMGNTTYLAMVGAFESLGASQEDLKMALTKFTIAQAEGGALAGVYTGMSTEQAFMQYLSDIAKAKQEGEDVGNIQKSLQEVLGRGNAKLWDALQDPANLKNLIGETKGIAVKKVGGEQNLSALITDSAKINKQMLKSSTQNKLLDSLEVAQIAKNPNIVSSISTLEQKTLSAETEKIKNLPNQIRSKEVTMAIGEATNKITSTLLNTTADIVDAIAGSDTTEAQIAREVFKPWWMGGSNKITEKKGK